MKKNNIKTAILATLLSIIIHLMALIFFKPKSAEPEPPAQNQQSKVSIKQQSDGKEETIWVNSGIRPCDYYEGIGVQFNGLTGIISFVAAGSPADKAGLVVGDELITPLWNMQLTFGQIVDITVKRSGQFVTLTALVDRICKE